MNAPLRPAMCRISFRILRVQLYIGSSVVHFGWENAERVAIAVSAGSRQTLASQVQQQLQMQLQHQQEIQKQLQT